MSTATPVSFSEATIQRFDREVVKYPDEQRQSAVMACLAIIQQERGHVTLADEAALGPLLASTPCRHGVFPALPARPAASAITGRRPP